MPRQEDVDAYLDTVKRIEPDVAPIDDVAFYASAAISLKRIADALEQRNELLRIQLGITQRGTYG